MVGDLALKDIRPDDMLDFREWWCDCVVNENLTFNSANKDSGTLKTDLKTVNEEKRLGVALPITGLSFRYGYRRAEGP